MQGELTNVIVCLETAVENVKQLSIKLCSYDPACYLYPPLVADE